MVMRRWAAAALCASAVAAAWIALRAAGRGSAKAAPRATEGPDEDVGGADRALRGYFAAIDARACDRLAAVSAKDTTPEACAATLGEFAQHGTRLVDVTRWARDGRDPSAMLASTRVTMDGRERLLVLRVERAGATWRVRL